VSRKIAIELRFTYTIDDRGMLNPNGIRQPTERRPQSAGRGMIGWAMFVGLAARSCCFE
jgi:hypothetical protein